MGKKIWLGAFLTLVILSSSIYILFEGGSKDLRIDFTKTRTIFKVRENGSFIVTGKEYTRIFDGTKLMRAKNRTITVFNRTDETEIIRVSNFKEGIVATDRYLFDNDVVDIENVPISHEICFKDAMGKIFEYMISDIYYDGDTKVITSPFSFGKDMKVSFEEGYYRAKVYNYKYASDKIKIRYRITEDNQCFNVRLFDPVSIDETIDLGNELSVKKDSSNKSMIIEKNNETIFNITSSTPFHYIGDFSKTKEWGYKDSGYEIYKSKKKSVQKGNHICIADNFIITNKDSLAEKKVYTDCIYYPPVLSKTEVMDYEDGSMGKKTLVNKSVNLVNITKINDFEFKIDFPDNYDPALSNLTEGLIGCWTGDVDGRDNYTGAYNATLTGAIVNTTFKKLGTGSFQCDGNDDIITLPVEQSFINLTISLWIKRRSFIANGRILQHEGIDFRLFDTAGGASISDWNNHAPATTGEWTFDISAMDSDFIHIVITQEANSTKNVTIYENNVIQSLAEIQAPSGTPVFSANNISLCNRISDLARDWDGNIDEINIWNTILNSSQVTELYNDGTGLTCDEIVATSSGNPPSTPTTIQCNGTSCNQKFTTSPVTVNCSGSIDDENNEITYVIEKGNLTIPQPANITYTMIDGIIWVEAENYTEKQEGSSNSVGITIANGTYSEGYGISSPDDGVDIPTSCDGTGDIFKYNVTVPSSTTYYFTGRVDYFGGSANSWYVCNGTDCNTVYTNGADDTLHWDDEISFLLNEGINQIFICMREDGTYFDKFVLSDESISTPSGNGTDFTPYIVRATVNYSIIGNHTNGSTFSWDITSEANETYERLRCRATDIEGSNTFSAYYIEDSNMTIAFGAPPPPEDSCSPDGSSSAIIQCSDRCNLSTIDFTGYDITFNGSGTPERVTIEDVTNYENFRIIGTKCTVVII